MYYFAGTTGKYLHTLQEESPGCYKTVFHLTNGQRKLRESATENRLPLCGKGEKVV